MHAFRLGRTVAMAVTTALLAGTALATAAPAQAASTISLTGPASVNAGSTAQFSVLVAGSATQWKAGISVVTTRVGVSSAPAIPLETAVTKNVVSPVPVNTSVSTTPGIYRVTVSLLEGGVVTNATSADFKVWANTAYSKSVTNTKMSLKMGKRVKTTFSVWGPSYQRGASAVVFYRFNGTKKFIKVASGKLNASGDAKLITKRGKIRKLGKYYVKISGVAYAGTYTTYWHVITIR
jgi:hypothetical protein